MASSPLRSKAPTHSRSISLPSRPPLLFPQLDDHLCRVRSSAEATSSSFSSIKDRLSGLEDLCNCVDDMVLLSNTQKLFAQAHHEKFVHEALDGYLVLLDVCSTIKDVFSQMKQDIQALLSVLRRRRRRDTSDLKEYLGFRKKAKKAIQKSLKDLKSIKNNKDHETVPAIRVLNEVEEAIWAVLGSLLSYISGTKVQSRQSGWSSVSKLMHLRSVASDDKDAYSNEFENVDAALNSLNVHKTSKSDNKQQVENVQNLLGNIEMSIQDVEDGLECLFRRLIKTRVSLLNILNH